MEDRKAKFIVFVVVCLLAFICSSTVFSMTGGLSDWIVSNVNTNEDANNNGYIDSSEGQYYSESDGQYYSSSDSYDNSNGGSGFLDGLFSSSDSSSNDYSSSDEEPDFLARLIREFIGGSSTTDSYYDSSDSNYYYEDTSNGYDLGNGFSYDLDELFTKTDNKLNQLFN